MASQIEELSRRAIPYTYVECRRFDASLIDLYEVSFLRTESAGGGRVYKSRIPSRPIRCWQQRGWKRRMESPAHSQTRILPMSEEPVK